VNAIFLESYHTCLGDETPPANAFGQSCYEGFHTLAGIASSIGTLDTRAFRRSEVLRSPCRSLGKESTRSVSGERRIAHLAAADEFEFRLVASY